MEFLVKEIKNLWNKAQGNYLYSGEEKKYLEAFLIQSCILEGVVKKLAILSIKKNLGNPTITTKKQKYYHFDTAIDDLYLLGIINKEEFEDLYQYKNARNDYTHNLIKKNYEELNWVLKDAYDRGDPLLWRIIRKLEKI